MVAYLIINNGEFGFWKEGGGCCNNVTAEDCHRPDMEASVTLTGGLLPMGWELRRDSGEGEGSCHWSGASGTSFATHSSGGSGYSSPHTGLQNFLEERCCRGPEALGKTCGPGMSLRKLQFLRAWE